MSMLLPGPYTSVQTLPCDLPGVLECPTYWRNDDGTRSFPMCDTAALYKDQQLPFTCGSQLRRSLIKYFYRDYCPMFRGDKLRSTLGLLVKQNVGVLRAGWVDPHNFACRDAATGLCTFAACDEGAMFEPCLDMAPFNVPIDAPTGQESVLTEWLSSAVKYYPFAMQDPRPWTTYYKASAAPGQASLPAQWGHSSTSALAAAHELLFSPSAPVLTHGPDEAYSMPSGKGLTPTQLLEDSPCEKVTDDIRATHESITTSTPHTVQLITRATTPLGTMNIRSHTPTQRAMLMHGNEKAARLSPTAKRYITAPAPPITNAREASVTWISW